MKVNIIVPVFNEEKTLGLVLTKLKQLDLRRLEVKKEIVVVNDGSTDGSKKILSGIKGIKLFNHSSNKGKGAAVKTGISSSNGEIIIIQDADLECNPKYIPFILEPIVKGKSEIVYGSRFLKEGNKQVVLFHEFGNIFLSFATSFLYNSKITDMETGYKAFKRTALDGITLKARGFDFEPEITSKFLKKGLSIKEIPVVSSSRTYKEGKKITAIDGIKALLLMIKFKFTD
ncbi:MAG: glycosyltransferase family 2 protein [Candidatus Diapherotrites archaeon]|uniref:Glycosyltransferase family 2 protein n=1 Tax=Candidatus Iainarchaeum sp. TaxID=3101447 RepID=A0A7J4IWG6_9ARCH|nr:MAG: glycosyl transferase family protein [archaeon GW2011_AR10]MBS3058954.1 glycosyltransferase family 2 protein [Candidatus Diapherotrites archaeon]HIH08619.1 glycosyltransferase family 2 protein [Candidatus Diapherotrites archaeon]